MNISHAKIFIVGVVLEAVFGATVLGPIAHPILIGAVAASVGLVIYRGRRLVLRRADGAERPEA